MLVLQILLGGKFFNEYISTVPPSVAVKNLLYLRSVLRQVYPKLFLDISVTWELDVISLTKNLLSVETVYNFFVDSHTTILLYYLNDFLIL